MLLICNHLRNFIVSTYEFVLEKKKNCAINMSVCQGIPVKALVRAWELKTRCLWEKFATSRNLAETFFGVSRTTKFFPCCTYGQLQISPFFVEGPLKIRENSISLKFNVYVASFEGFLILLNNLVLLHFKCLNLL
jgi:hypothetical protein